MRNLRICRRLRQSGRLQLVANWCGQIYSGDCPSLDLLCEFISLSCASPGCATASCGSRAAASEPSQRQQRSGNDSYRTIAPPERSFVLPSFSDSDGGAGSTATRADRWRRLSASDCRLTGCVVGTKDISKEPNPIWSNDSWQPLLPRRRLRPRLVGTL